MLLNADGIEITDEKGEAKVYDVITHIYYEGNDYIACADPDLSDSEEGVSIQMVKDLGNGKYGVVTDEELLGALFNELQGFMNCEDFEFEGGLGDLFDDTDCCDGGCDCEDCDCGECNFEDEENFDFDFDSLERDVEDDSEEQEDFEFDSLDEDDEGRKDE